MIICYAAASMPLLPIRHAVCRRYAAACHASMMPLMPLFLRDLMLLLDICRARRIAVWHSH